MTESRNLMCKRLMSLGLTKHFTHRLVDEAQKWLARNGTEWTIKRLKDAKAYYLSTLAGKEPEMDLWWAKRGDNFKSPWLRIPISNEKDLVRAIRACNAYTLFINSGNPTSAQLRKFYNSVEQEKRSLSTPRELTSLLGVAADSKELITKLLEMSGLPQKDYKPIQASKRLEGPRKFYEYIYSNDRRAPTVSPRQRDVEAEMKWVLDNITSPAVMGRLYKYRGLASQAGFTQVLHQAKIAPDCNYGGGKISYIQEPGFKLRAVANPFRVHQVILEPVKKAIMRKLESLPSDCTHDQMSGALWAQAKLREGRTVHAVDLSDATNNIPFAPQILTLCLDLQLDIHDKTTNDLLSYFVECSRDQWITPEGKTIRWSRGQPLGLGPSFGAFALWHNRLLNLCHRAVNSEFAADDAFRIVGDDVVIACDATHRQYRKCLEHMDIPVSEAKCISSNKCTEFVGFVVTPTALHPIPKWKSPSDRNFMDVLRQIGPQGMSWLRPRQRAVAKLLAPIPEEFGGLGWNPKGVPLEDRIAAAASLGLLDERPESVPLQEQTRSAIALINKVCYNGGIKLWTDYVSSKLGCHHKPTRLYGLSDITQVIPINVGLDGDVNENFIGTPGYRVGPAVSSGDPRGKTQLETLEQKLDIKSEKYGDNFTVADQLSEDLTGASHEDEKAKDDRTTNHGKVVKSMPHPPGK